VTSVTDEFEVPPALVDIEDTPSDETVVLAVEVAELVSKFAAFDSDGRWTTVYWAGGGAAMEDLMFWALRARSA
jgi:hypothetical protein